MIDLKEYRMMSGIELATIQHYASKELEARNRKLKDGRWILDVPDEDIVALNSQARRGSQEWYSLQWEIAVRFGDDH